MDSEIINISVTSGSLNNGYLSLAEVIDFFPQDMIGGSNSLDNVGRKATLNISGISQPVYSDIDGEKRIFRTRIWKAFFKYHNTSVGDTISVERINPYHYKVYPAKSVEAVSSGFIKNREPSVYFDSLSPSDKLSNMPKEKDLEDIISKYPDLIELNLTLLGRQLNIFGRRIDLLFEDSFGRQLIIELKNGPIKDEHIGQILSYEGTLLSADHPDIRVMLVGTRVPPNIRRALDYHGISWKELTYSYIKSFLINKNDSSWLHLFHEEMVIRPKYVQVNKIENHIESKKPVNLHHEKKVAGIKIYKGSSSTLHNVNASLIKPLNFTGIERVRDINVRHKLEQLSKRNEPIYVWAGLANIQKKIDFGNPIYFFLADELEFYELIYIDDVKDDNSEIQRHVGWVGNGFENVVFMNNMSRRNITPNQIREIIDLLGATYRETGVARYIYNPTLNSIQLKRLQEILQ